MCRTFIFLAAILCLMPVASGQGTPTELQRRAVEAWNQNQLPEAERLLRISLQANPNNAVTLGLLAEVLDSQGKLQEAEPYYHRALLLTPGSVPLLNNYANHCAQMGDESRARELFLRVLQLEPKQRNARLQLGQIAVNRKNGHEALRYLASISGQQPGIALLRAEALSLAGQPGKAMMMIDGVEKEYSSNPKVLLAVGMLLVRIERYDAAERVLSQALAENPVDAETLFQLGLAAARAGHTERAKSILEEAQRNRPGNAAILSALGRVYATENDHPGAVELLAEAHKLAPKDKSNLLALAQALDAAGSPSEATHAYDELVALDPSNEDIRCARALDYAATGKFDEASAELKRYIALFPRDAQGYFKLALITEVRDDEGSLVLLNKALKLDPNLIAARGERGIVLQRLGRLKEALPDLEASAAAEPDNVEVLSPLGSVLLSLGRPQDAEAMLSKATEIDPENRAVLMHLGKALSAVGKDSESKEVLARLEALGPATGDANQQKNNMIALVNLSPAQRINAAISRLQKAVERKPDDLAIRIRLGNALLEAGRKDEAASVFTNIHSDQPAVQFALAQGLDRSVGPEAALQKLDQISEGDRNGEFYLFRAMLLKEDGRNAEACDTVQQNIRSMASDAHWALSASLMEIECGKYSAARDLASKAHTIPASFLIDAIALNQSGRQSQASSELHTAESCWPGWGKPYLIEGALMTLRGDASQAIPRLNIAQSLGENAVELRKCLDGGKDCADVARQTMIGEVAGPGFPEEQCARLNASR